VRQRRETVGSIEGDAAAAVVGCRPDAVVTDVAAARIWDLPLPLWLQDPSDAISVAVPAGNARPKRAGVRGRRLDLPSFHVVDVGSLRVTTPARTWLDCAPLLPFGDIVAMGDAILHRRLGSTGELNHLSQWGFRRRGIVGIRLALPLLDARSESPGESRARVLLIRGGIPAPVCNYNVVERGRWIARVDMAWIEQRVIVEYDGAVHLDERQRRRDAERLNHLQGAGWRVIVLTADDLRRPDSTVQMVKLALGLAR